MQQANVQLVPTWQYRIIEAAPPATMEADLNQFGAECWELVGVIPGIPAESSVIGTGHLLILKKLSGFMGAAAETPLVVGAALPMPGSGPRRLS